MTEKDNNVVALFQTTEVVGISEMLTRTLEENPDDTYDYAILLMAKEGQVPAISTNSIHVDTLAATVSRALWAINLLSAQDSAEEP
jgi:hypothetical protein